MNQLLTVSGLSVRFGTRHVVDEIGLTIAEGECVAVVGESGSGKSVTARSLIGLSGGDARADTHEFLGRDVRRASERDWRKIRGKEIGFVLQDAMGSLDPLRPVVSEIDEAVKLHSSLGRSARRAEIDRLLMRVGLPRSEDLGQRRSDQLSGGQRQRALIASAIAAAPRLLIADEPTTALDASTQNRIVTLLDSLRTDGMGLLLISHDLGVVARIADRVLVMHGGRIVDSGSREEIFSRPSSEHTRLLLSSIPSTAPRGVPLLTEPASTVRTTASDRRDARLAARGISREFSRRGRRIRAVHDVEICVQGGRTLGLVGESGSGKSTLARMLVGREKPLEGEVTLNGTAWAPLPERKRRPRRRSVGFVSQDSLGSFDPRWNVRRILADALVDDSAGRADREDAVRRLLQDVRLGPEILERNSAALSGGERQRVSIARALAGDPELLILDEAVSALDASVAAHVMDLFDRLQRERDIGYLLISHDLGVVRHMSDEIAVMWEGRIVEHGATEEVLEAPEHPYTIELLRNVFHVPRRN